MDLKKEYGVSKELEIEGVWIAIDDDTEVKVARLGNKKYMNEIERLSVPHRRILNDKTGRNSTKKNAIANEIMCKVFARTIVLDWKNLLEGGKEVEYSYTECLRMLTEYPDFKDVIATEAEDMDNFFAEEIEEVKENLS